MMTIPTIGPIAGAIMVQNNDGAVGASAWLAAYSATFRLARYGAVPLLCTRSGMTLPRVSPDRAREVAERYAASLNL